MAGNIETLDAVLAMLNEHSQTTAQMLVGEMRDDAQAALDEGEVRGGLGGVLMDLQCQGRRALSQAAEWHGRAARAPYPEAAQSDRQVAANAHGRVWALEYAVERITTMMDTQEEVAGR